MNLTFPFLSPAWLAVVVGFAVVISFVLPLRWRRWWLMMGGGIFSACVVAALGWVPWLTELHLTGYSLAMLAGFVAAYLVTMPRARIVGIHERTIMDLFMVGLVGGLVGARIGEIIEQWPAFGRDAAGQPLAWRDFLSKAADIDGGGMVWYGAAILGGVLIVWVAHFRRVRILELADLFIPATILGLGFGRVGCFLNGCCYGCPTTMPWAVAGTGGAHSHPTQLYETVACVLLFALAWWWWRHRRWQGEIAALTLLGYAFWRFFNESLRGDTVASSFIGWTVTTSQAVSLYLIVAVFILTAWVCYRRLRSPSVAEQGRHVPGSCHHRAVKRSEIAAEKDANA